MSRTMNMNSTLREINILESELKPHMVSDNELIHSHPSGHRNSIIFVNKQGFFLENRYGTICTFGASLIRILATLVPWCLGKNGDPTKSISKGR